MIYLFCSFKSEGVVDLRDAIKAKGVDCIRIKENHGQKFQYGPMFNWGCGDGSAPNLAQIVSGKFYNSREAIATSCSKIRTYQSLLEHDVWTVAMTQRYQRALEWQQEGRTVLARADWGSNGEGIKVIKPGTDLPTAQFYSRLFPSTHEFRVHVAFGKVIDITLKVKRESESWEALNKPYDPIVRNFGGGWRLSHENVENALGGIESSWAHELRALGVAAIKAVGLDFGAVDMLANLDPNYLGQRFVVCETNSAPAMELDKTLEAYANAFIAQANKDKPAFTDHGFEA